MPHASRPPGKPRKAVGVVPADQQSMLEGRLYPALHLLRALAAISIFAGHWSERYLPQLWPQGQIAIDVFFMIEGFLAMRLLTEGHGQAPAGRRIIERFVQVYPVYAIGLFVGFCAFAPQALAGSEGWTIGRWLAALLSGLLLLPTFSTALVHGSVFPLNPPTWAIVLELIGFALLAVARSRRSGSVLLVWGAGVVAFMLLAVHWHDPNAGWGTINYWGGFPRMIFAFFGGAILFPLHARMGGRIPQLSPIWIVAIFGAMHMPTVRFVAWPLFVIGVPALITLAASSRRPKWSLAVGAWAARYALLIYVLGYPITILWRNALAGQRPPASAPGIGLDFLLVMGTVVIAAMAIKRARAILSRPRRDPDCVIPA